MRFSDDNFVACFLYRPVYIKNFDNPYRFDPT